MASVGEAHSFLPTQSLVTKLQIRRVSCSSGEMECLPFESKIVDAGFNNETIEVQQHHVVAVGRGPTKLEIEHHVTSGHAQHRTWCDACMGARGAAGRRAKRESDERARTRLLDCTEDNDGGEDDEVAQNKFLILVAKDVKTGTHAATCPRGKGVSEYATSWMVCLLRRLGYRRAILHGDGEPSIVALQTATFVAAPHVELVLRESPVGEHTSKGVAESAMREVKRQTRTLKFALEPHVGKIVESHPILRWIPTMASDAISFFSGNAYRRDWKKLVIEFGERVYRRPAVARTNASGMQPKLHVGSTTHAPAFSRRQIEPSKRQCFEG